MEPKLTKLTDDFSSLDEPRVVLQNRTTPALSDETNIGWQVDGKHIISCFSWSPHGGLVAFFFSSDYQLTPGSLDLTISRPPGCQPL
jgi:hypothetical protein